MWVVLKLLLEAGLSFKQIVHENVVSHCNHDTVSNRHKIARNKTGLIPSQLSLNRGEEETPLRSDQFLKLGVLGRSEAHRHHDVRIGTDKLTPSVNDPIDARNLPPVLGIIVAVLDAKTSQNRTHLLHFNALVRNDG